MSRILLHKDVYDAVSERIVDLVKKIKVGHPLDPDSTMGPINSKPQYEKVLNYIEIGKEGGASLPTF